ncbi:MAG TPA: hypothetical protein VE868_09015, partial [Balneolaceae bacterium]|nr:hypothetical protein [Balneolaceae bacterium]
MNKSASTFGRLIRWSSFMLSLFLLIATVKVTTAHPNLSSPHPYRSLNDSVPTINNGLAKTPPMGWNSWNAFHTHIN